MLSMSTLFINKLIINILTINILIMNILDINILVMSVLIINVLNILQYIYCSILIIIYNCNISIILCLIITNQV